MASRSRTWSFVHDWKLVLLHAMNVSHGTHSFTFHPKEVMLPNFIALKNALRSAWFEPMNHESNRQAHLPLKFSTLFPSTFYDSDLSTVMPLNTLSYKTNWWPTACVQPLHFSWWLPSRQLYQEALWLILILCVVDNAFSILLSHVWSHNKLIHIQTLTVHRYFLSDLVPVLVQSKSLDN